MQASQRLDRFGAEVFASLNNKLLALKAQGKTIYNMSVGTPDFKPYDHVVEALTQAAQDPEMWKYALRDLPELKQAVCDYYERRFGVCGNRLLVHVISFLPCAVVAAAQGFCYFNFRA